MYKKILLFAALNAMASAQGATIYKCVDAQGATSFQSQTCPGKTTQTEVVLRKDPTPAPDPFPPPAPPLVTNANREAESLRRQAPPAAAALAPVQVPSGNVSYQCTVPATKMVFYVHSKPCPKEMVAGGGSEFYTNSSGVLEYRNRSAALPVTQKIVSRREACHEISKPSASDREGYNFDERTPTYEKLVGRDPCRRQ